ncbi:LOW QUALITY PROTEIN: replication factor C subunit 5 [Cyprinus carpio]|uniref:Activator 1 subunit 5 n=1 Tax=Cyprinus carpio TaxID=7962 RepID=A0A9Q9W9N6_CYPCA|nr:LOW QUALITY PROTEIN: replication factor C subunit 5 [Cyprinus carpio]
MASTSKVQPQTRNLPWVEKYRPQTLDDLISHQDILSTIQKFISEDRLPHLLFYGPPGTGKTSTILACAKQLYKDKEFNSMVLELNASDDRGIDVVRGPILSFASTRTIFKKGFKLVILDEADAMTQRWDAQKCFEERRYSHPHVLLRLLSFIANLLSSCRSISKARASSSVNSGSKRYGSLVLDRLEKSPSFVYLKISHVHRHSCTVKERKPASYYSLPGHNFEQIKPNIDSIDITPDGMKAIVTLSTGDMRRSLNILQSTHMAYGKVTEEMVYTCTGHPLRSDIANILDWALNKDFTTAYNQILQLKTLKGLALHDILTEVHLLIHRVDFPPSIRMGLLIKLADIEYRLASGTNEKIQLSSMVAAFQAVRDIVVSDG